MRPSMKDIAEAAGVSRPTVSLILSGSDGKYRISEETRAKVLEAALRLGFRRNELAASVKSGKSKTIAFIGGGRTGYIMEILAGINAAAAKEGYTLKIFDAGGRDWNPEAVAGSCVSQMVDGAICRALPESELEIFRQELSSHGIPVVLVDNSFEHDWCARVISDDVSGAAMAVEHLASLGRKRIAHVSSNKDSGFAALRREGYLKGLADAGLPFDSSLILDLPKNIDVDFDANPAICEFLSKTKPDAVFCASDPVAMRVLRAAHELGVKVPKELSVAGFANLEYASLASPPLTSVVQPFMEMGWKAAEILFEALKEGKSSISGTLKLPVSMALRQSTAKA